MDSHAVCPAMKSVITAIALIIWAPVTILFTSLLMVNHTIAMPMPNDLQQVEQGLVEWLGRGDAVVHVLYANCSCTDSLVEHLVQRGSTPALREVVVFVGTSTLSQERLADVGFEWHQWSQLELTERTGLEAAPLLVIRQHNRLDYFRFPGANRPLDVRIIDDTTTGDPPKPLPIFGCAVSPSLRAIVDPLGLQGPATDR
jgi:hypothetical protein